MEKKRSMPEIIAASNGIWKNSVCKGYVIDALRSLGYGDRQIHQVCNELSCSFERLSTADAEVVYCRSPF